MSHAIDECYDVYNETWRRARKKHRCDACRETIPVGIRYARVFFIFDGRRESLKRCARCQAIHEHLRDKGLGGRYEDTWPDERLDCGETYQDHWDEDPPPEIAALAFALPGEVDKPSLTD